jgi:hypothetical protein
MKHLRLRRWALAEESLPSGNPPTELGEAEKRLLAVIALSYAQNRPLTVSVARAVEPIAGLHTPNHKLGLQHKLRQIYGQMFFDRKNC